MSRVRQRNTQPEILIRSFLRSKGFRFRLQVKKLPGTPDIVLPELRKVVFINGCFWHQHPRCLRAAIPKSNRTFWVAKLLRNAERDKKTKRRLRKLGWSVITLWECQLRNAEMRQACLNKLRRRLEQE
jgi:DNA mismatch endonuclease (patch repair protein)